MKMLSSALVAHPKRIVATAVAILGVASAVATAGGPNNFVSFYATGNGTCWYDMNASTGSNDAKEEGAAGRASNTFGSFQGIGPENNVGTIRSCASWTAPGGHRGPSNVWTP